MAVIQPKEINLKNGTQILIRGFQSGDEKPFHNFIHSAARDSTHTLKYPDMPAMSDENLPWIQHIARFAMAIRKVYWGQGLGKILLQEIELHCRAAGIRRIEAEVRSSNDRGLELYKKHGFKIEGLREKAALIDGQFQDEYFIAKVISI